MPFPTDKAVLDAIEKAIREGLAAQGGTWIAMLSETKELSFPSPNDSGEISVTVYLDDAEVENLPDDGDVPIEKTYKLRVSVELVEE